MSQSPASQGQWSPYKKIDERILKCLAQIHPDGPTQIQSSLLGQFERNDKASFLIGSKTVILYAGLWIQMCQGWEF